MYFYNSIWTTTKKTFDIKAYVLTSSANIAILKLELTIAPITNVYPSLFKRFYIHNTPSNFLF